ncbi:MAG: hypothetical protein ACRECY_03705 [Phyllobacterium sp.]
MRYDLCLPAAEGIVSIDGFEDVKRVGSQGITWFRGIAEFHSLADTGANVGGFVATADWTRKEALSEARDAFAHHANHLDAGQEDRDGFDLKPGIGRTRCLLCRWSCGTLQHKQIW